MNRTVSTIKYEATALLETSTGPLTYEDYMAEGEINRRYDILDGVRVYMANASASHCDIMLNVALLLRDYQRANRKGRTVLPPCDVLISRSPLRTRQPDALFISRTRFGPRLLFEPGPLDPAPELVVEVLPPGETRSAREGKITDYCAVGVVECWAVNTDAQSVEVLRLTQDGPVREALYGAGQTLQSLTFPDLTLALGDIFRIKE